MCPPTPSTENSGKRESGREIEREKKRRGGREREREKKRRGGREREREKEERESTWDPALLLFPYCHAGDSIKPKLLDR